MSSAAQRQPRPSWRHDFKPGEVENGFVEYYAAWSALGLAPVIVAVSADALISEKHETLQEWLDRHPRGPERDTMGRCLRARVVELHSHGYCHRDLHRDNVLIRHDGVPLFIDPAFAVAADPEAPCYDLVGGSRSGISVVPDHRLIPGLENGVYWDVETTAVRSLSADFRPQAELA
jgi:phosphotransferase family enzyme